jgi:hypothetical protein
LKLNGLRVKGSARAYLSPDEARPADAPDTLLFQRQPDESWKVWIRVLQPISDDTHHRPLALDVAPGRRRLRLL